MMIKDGTINDSYNYSSNFASIMWQTLNESKISALIAIQNDYVIESIDRIIKNLIKHQMNHEMKF